MDNPSRQFALLLVDDEPAVLASLKRIFRQMPYDLHMAGNGNEALEVLEQIPIDAALVDLKMPGMDGMQLLEAMQSRWPDVRVVILTGHGGVREAVTAIKLGAVDFLQKPFETENLQTRIYQLYHIWSLEQENRCLREQVQFKFGFNQLIGNAPLMLSLKKMILQASQSDASVLIQGETGTGKELVALAIHHHSPRSGHPFVPVDCAGISETVIGSELFGHVKGAFTGAHESTLGLIRSADKGTLFLDEIGELPLSLQSKLLRTIQEKEVRPVGASRSFPVDVRILAVTNRNLEEEVEQGRFRQDLYYRLDVVMIRVPPLRDRIEDLPILARFFVEQFRTPVCPVTGVSKDALDCMMAYDWPGNVRELENVIRRAVAMGQNDHILPVDLPDSMNGLISKTPAIQDAPSSDSLEAYEMAAIRNALSKSRGHRKHAAQLLGIGEATLYRKLKRYKV